MSIDPKFVELKADVVGIFISSMEFKRSLNFRPGYQVSGAFGLVICFCRCEFSSAFFGVYFFVLASQRTTRPRCRCTRLSCCISFLLVLTSFRCLFCHFVYYRGSRQYRTSTPVQLFFPRHTRKQVISFEAGTHICKNVRTRCRSPPHMRFLVGCSSPSMRLAEHLTVLRAWCTQCLAGR